MYTMCWNIFWNVFLLVFSRDISVKFLGSRAYYERYKERYENVGAGN